ncbi:odorant receptor 2a-like isoform X1 [Microplitis mediator]|uniref:odorant receptor 2a-like isoform X1 n=1 Tax=Microplitis mediator TaxID=375433 RepID=UPI0025558805|nr:odorant receptor 2a-like isoform X1 [Microplitis mediator]
MTVLEDSFFLFTCVGFWRPIKWNGLKANLYNFYTAFVVITNCSFFISGITDIDYVHFNLFGSMDLISLLLQFAGNVPKILCVINNRNIVLEVLRNFQSGSLESKNDDEKLIQQKYDNFNRRVILWFPVLMFASIIWYTINHIAIMEPPTVLPYKGRIPYNYSSNKKVYLLTAANQIYSVFNIASTNAAFHTLFPTMMFQICAKINILEYRFKMMLKKFEPSENNNSEKLSKENFYDIEINLIGDWVESHIKLLNLYDSLNSLFTKAVFVHYIFNTFSLCAIAYISSHIPFGSSASVSFLYYFSVKCSQQFLQCASAHQVTIEFENLRDTIFDTNWYTTKRAVQNSMIIIMSKTMIPVVFVCGYFVDLSLDSFKSIMKLSYTIYNVLE